MRNLLFIQQIYYSRTAFRSRLRDRKEYRDAHLAVVRAGGVGDGDGAEDAPADPGRGLQPILRVAPSARVGLAMHGWSITYVLTHKQGGRLM